MSTTTPTAVQDFQSQTPSLEPDLDDEDDPNAAGDWQVLDYPDPISHGIGVESVINDLDDDDLAFCPWCGSALGVEDVPDEDPSRSDL